MDRPPARLWWLWLAQFFSMAGDRLHYLALVSVATLTTAAVVEVDPSVALTAIAAAMLLPTVLFAPLAGPIVDRAPLVPLLVGTDALRGVLVLALPAVLLTFGFAPLLAGVFVLFTLNVFFLPARAALPPQLVAEERLFATNAFLALGAVLAVAAGTLGGAWLIDRVGWRPALWIDAGTFLVSALCLSWIRTERQSTGRRMRTSAGRYLREILGGFRFLIRSREGRLASLVWIVPMVGAGALHVAGTLHVQQTPGEVSPIGWVLASLAAGLGTGFLAAMRSRKLASSAFWGPGLIVAGGALLVFTLVRSLAPQCLAAAAAGLAAGPALASAETTLQRCAGDRRRARVFAVRDFLSRLVFLASASAAALLHPRWGEAGALLAAASVLTVTGVVLWRATPRASARTS